MFSDSGYLKIFLEGFRGLNKKSFEIPERRVNFYLDENICVKWVTLYTNIRSEMLCNRYVYLNLIENKISFSLKEFYCIAEAYS